MTLDPCPAVRALQRQLNWLRDEAMMLTGSLWDEKVTDAEAEQAHLLIATERAQLIAALRILDTNRVCGPVLPMTFRHLPGHIRTRLGGSRASPHTVVTPRSKEAEAESPCT